MKRRDFLSLGTAGLASAITGSSGLIAWSGRAEAAVISKTFYITDGFITQIDGTNVYFRGYSDSSTSLNIPGKSMIVQQGDTVKITLINTLNTAHNFVIDGMANSGTVAAGNSKTFSFIAGNPGTYMFYDNINSNYNQLLGLHGAIAVMPQNSSNELYAGSRTFVKQQFWLFHDIDPAWHDRLRRGRTPNTAYVPRYFTLNGLSGRPPGAPGNKDPNINNMIDPRSALHGSIGDRTLVRILNAGLAAQSVHTHANHMEWLSENGQNRPDVWEKDCLYLDGNRGILDMIYPYDVPPDSWPPATLGEYPMHLHSEMSQTAAGGYYLFGAITDIFFV